MMSGWATIVSIRHSRTRRLRSPTLAVRRWQSCPHRPHMRSWGFPRFWAESRADGASRHLTAPAIISHSLSLRGPRLGLQRICAEIGPATCSFFGTRHDSLPRLIRALWGNVSMGNTTADVRVAATPCYLISPSRLASRPSVSHFQLRSTRHSSLVRSHRVHTAQQRTPPHTTGLSTKA